MPRKRKVETSIKSQNHSGKAIAKRRGNDSLLPINQQFAGEYDARKRRELLNSAPSELINENEESSTSSSEDEDEHGELLTKGVDRQVRETLEAIRNRDPRIYDGTTKFFNNPSGNGTSDDDDGGSSDSDGEEVNSDDEPVAGWDTIANAAKQSSKLTLKDYVRENLLKHGNLSDSDSAEDDANHERPDYEHDHDEVSRAAAGANKGVKKSLEEVVAPSVNDENGTDDGDNGDDDDDFFKRKEKSGAEIEQEQKELEHFIKKAASKGDRTNGEELLLHSYLEKETPDEKERFLRDFVLNNGWLDKNANEAPSANDYEIEIDLPQEENDDQDEDSFDDKVDEFEASYNFRFEDPEGSKIVSHSRYVPDSIRRPDERRKLARQAKKERKLRERAEKTEDIKRLKNAKKREVQARLLAIKEAAGDDVDIAGLDLDGDFDPEAFNKQMEQQFGDEYYAQQDAQMETLEKQGIASVSDARVTSDAVEQAPDDIREDVNRMLDEYYNLDYGDIVGGKPMRFNYKRVAPESFSMSTQQILEMDDKELNRLVSIKYLAPYRAKRDVTKQSWRVKEELKKRKSTGNTEEADEPESRHYKKEKSVVNLEHNIVEQDVENTKAERSKRRNKQKRARMAQE